MKAAYISFLAIVAVIFGQLDSSAQGVMISADSEASPDGSALLDIDASGMTEKKGLLIPRMSESERDNIADPATGLLVYQTDGDAGFKYYDGTAWVGFAGGLEDNLGDHTATENLSLNGYWLSGDGTNEGIKITETGKVGFGVDDPNSDVHMEGSVQLNDLAGSGTRMVVADSEGQLSTQTIPSGGVGGGTTLYLNVTSDQSNLDVSGVSFIHATSDHNSNEINGLVGGVQNQVIYLINTSNKDLKFKKDTGTQQFIADFDLKKEEGGMIMYSGSQWHVISKH